MLCCCTQCQTQREVAELWAASRQPSATALPASNNSKDPGQQQFGQPPVLQQPADGEARIEGTAARGSTEQHTPSTDKRKVSTEQRKLSADKRWSMEAQGLPLLPLADRASLDSGGAWWTGQSGAGTLPHMPDDESHSRCLRWLPFKVCARALGFTLGVVDQELKLQTETQATSCQQ